MYKVGGSSKGVSWVLFNRLAEGTVPKGLSIADRDLNNRVPLGEFNLHNKERQALYN